MAREVLQSRARPALAALAPTRAELEIDEHSLYLTMADGRWRGAELRGARIYVRDAAYVQRFVRHAVIRAGDERIDLITPPEAGAIAPRAARLPSVPRHSAIIVTRAWNILTQWVRTGGGLGGRTVAELAELAVIATSQFALALGEHAAELAVQMSWERLGPMRSAGDVRRLLRSFEDEACASPRVMEALVAALSRWAALREPAADVS
jgi:hypothetical protein